jgi:hypothetical protein
MNEVKDERNELNAPSGYVLFDAEDRVWLAKDGQDDSYIKGFSTDSSKAKIMTRIEAEKTLDEVEQVQFGLGIEPSLEIISQNK